MRTTLTQATTINARPGRLAPWIDSVRADKHKQAGLTYFIGGLLVILFTFVTELIPQNRIAEAFLLFPGVLVVAFFAVLVYRGPTARRSVLAKRRWTPNLVKRAAAAAPRWTARILAVTNGVRAVLFLLNALGQNLHFTFTPNRLLVVSSDPEPLFLVNAAVMAVIAMMLARAGWESSQVA
jgi:hypothetical protein